MNEGLKQHVISVDIRKVFDKIHAVYDKQNSKKVRYRRKYIKMIMTIYIKPQSISEWVELTSFPPGSGKT